MKRFVIAYIGVLVSYLILDGIWLGVVAKDSYVEAMEGMLRKDYPVTPWVAFYLLYSIAVVKLVVMNNINNAWWKAFVDGAILGMAAYGAYNLTNYAILEGWPIGITIKDWLWGTFVTAAISTTGWFALKKFSTQ